MAGDQSGTFPESPSPPAPPAAKGTARSPVERALVWGGILALLIVVLIEWRASAGLKADSEAVHAAMEQSEKGYLTEPELTRLMTRFSRRESQSGLTANELAASRVDTFDYGGILKKRLLYVYFGLPRPGHEQEVLQIGEVPIRMYTREDFGIGPEKSPVNESTDQADRTDQETASESQDVEEPTESADTQS